MMPVGPQPPNPKLAKLGSPTEVRVSAKSLNISLPVAMDSNTDPDSFSCTNGFVTFSSCKSSVLSVKENKFINKACGINQNVSSRLCR